MASAAPCCVVDDGATEPAYGRDSKRRRVRTPGGVNDGVVELACGQDSKRRRFPTPAGICKACHQEALQPGKFPGVKRTYSDQASNGVCN